MLCGALRADGIYGRGDAAGSPRFGEAGFSSIFSGSFGALTNSSIESVGATMGSPRFGEVGSVVCSSSAFGVFIFVFNFDADFVDARNAINEKIVR